MKKLFVGNLPYAANEQDLQNFFSEGGVTVDTVIVMRDRFTGQARGFGFVEINDDAVAQHAIESLNGKDLMGRAVVVNEARPMASRADAGGGGGDRGPVAALTGGELRENPPWLFGILSLPYGTFNAILVVLIPFLLRKHGISPDRIAKVIAISSIPNVWYFLWSPVVDIGLLRRQWVLIAAGVSAVCAAAAIAAPSLSLGQLTLLLLGGNAICMLLSSACGAVLTALNPAMRGSASGWYQAGNLGGGALGAGAAIWLADKTPLPALALAAAAMVFLPALAALLISEEPVPRLAVIPLFRAMGREVWDVLRAPATLVGLIFFLSPVGSSAVVNLISSLGPDYHASDRQVAWVSGIAGGLLSALGCVVGGFLCDRMNRMSAYALAGLLSAIFAAWMALGPASPFTYSGGYAGYALASGIAYAAFTAVELEVLGKRRHAAGAAYSLLGASGNLPIVYMTWLDGAGYKRSGARGLMGVDALANGVGGALLLLFAWYCARRWKR